MGIRMLHRRTAQAQARVRAWADAASVPPSRPRLVPALAADASTARIPTDLATTARKAATAATALGRRLAHHVSRPGLASASRRWADLARSYLALLLALLPRPRPPRTITVFVATLAERPDGTAPRRTGRTARDRQDPDPDATP